MKTNSTHIAIAALFSLCLFCASSAPAQTAAVLNSQVQPMQMMGHEAHASRHAMGVENNLLGDSSYYSYAQGEIPLAEVGSLPYQPPLGDVARAYRKEHASEPKAVKTLEKQGG